MEFVRYFFSQFEVKDFIDISIVAFIFYRVFVIVKGTKAFQMLLGIGILISLILPAYHFKLHTLQWILTHLFDSFLIISVILFQDQFRSALASVGSGRKLWIRSKSKADIDASLNEIVEAMFNLANEKIGALLVIERNNGLLNYIETGSKIFADIQLDLIYAIFQSKSPLHDGAIIIQDHKISAVGCFLPLSKNNDLDKHLGTRHRSALGISEQTDAIALVVSEETGKISACFNGILYSFDTAAKLRSFLYALLKSTGNINHLTEVMNKKYTETG